VVVVVGDLAAPRQAEITKLVDRALPCSLALFEYGGDCDHFRGFESYWKVPVGETTRYSRALIKGPGEDFLSALQNAFSDYRSWRKTSA